ncbi:membrane protein [Vibrio natriegens NBRC 15636 = ATCC 14048 = DSM 759]|nr:membrane protein [Vibrio natriegens NBRC 15636 = ATCC 14048 = DSM 759]
MLQFKEVFMEHDLKSALIIVAAVFAVLLSYGIIAITSA